MGARDGWGEVDGAEDVVGARVPDATDGHSPRSSAVVVIVRDSTRFLCSVSVGNAIVEWTVCAVSVAELSCGTSVVQIE
eukprot:scaffold2642_cov293-Alexandrium_tamarense.AAC.1